MLVITKKTAQQVQDVINHSQSTDLLNAVTEYDQQKTRADDPSGYFDSAGRWYPHNMCPCCESIRPPSRKYPYSLLKHCRSADHVASQYGVNKKELVKTYNLIKKLGGLDAAVDLKAYLTEILNDRLTSKIELSLPAMAPGLVF